MTNPISLTGLITASFYIQIGSHNTAIWNAKMEHKLGWLRDWIEYVNRTISRDLSEIKSHDRWTLLEKFRIDILVRVWRVFLFREYFQPINELQFKIYNWWLAKYQFGTNERLLLSTKYTWRFFRRWEIKRVLI